MTERRTDKLILKLRAILGVFEEELTSNSQFARKIEAALSSYDAQATRKADARSLERRLATAADDVENKIVSRSILNTAANGFDPLELHLEAALMNGREDEARAFLGRLNRAQLEEVVKAQRLPGARALQRTIQEGGDPASAVDAIVGSAAEKVRGRHHAAS